MPSKALVAASLRPVMLSFLHHGPAYGYEIIQYVAALSDGRLAYTAGTLYPVLHRLETDGLIESFWQPSDAGPRRKYYRLTPAGEDALAVEKREWLDLHGLLVKLWGPELPRLELG